MSNEHHAVIVVSKKNKHLSSKDSSDTSCLLPNKMFCHVFLNLEYDCELLTYTSSCIRVSQTLISGRGWVQF